MDLVLSESFVAVADAGTISAAAKHLSISQSALSRRLQQLERDLGAQLLLRQRDGVELTPAGHRALVVSRAVVDQYRQLRHELRQEVDLSVGLVRVGGGATAASMLLAPSIAKLHRAHAGLRFYLREAGSGSVAAEVARGSLDLGIVTTPVDETGLRLEPLLEDQIVLAVRSGHPLARSTIRPHHLHGQPVIGFESGSAIRRIIDEALLGASVQVEIVAELRSIPTMLEMVRETGIPAFVSRLSVARETDLVPVEVRGLTITRHLATATRTHVASTPATTAFLDVLRNVASDQTLAGVNTAASR